MPPERANHRHVIRSLLCAQVETLQLLVSWCAEENRIGFLIFAKDSRDSADAESAVEDLSANEHHGYAQFRWSAIHPCRGCHGLFHYRLEYHIQLWRDVPLKLKNGELQWNSY